MIRRIILFSAITTCNIIIKINVAVCWCNVWVYILIKRKKNIHQIFLVLYCPNFQCNVHNLFYFYLFKANSWKSVFYFNSFVCLCFLLRCPVISFTVYVDVKRKLASDIILKLTIGILLIFFKDFFFHLQLKCTVRKIHIILKVPTFSYCL